MDSTVSLSSGALRGAVADGVHSFRGIPYAAPVGGANRFLRPQPVQPWDGERDATRDGLIQPQVPMPPPFGGELPPAGDDSLNLNVWTPDPSASGLPVLVWIHGGAFNAGSGIEPVYDGASFARNGVVCVTFNYRLGAQGFLHLAELFPQFPDSGNLGILDQVAALQWVRDNIAAFGGDPQRVTIAGESAGGMSVGTLMALPDARGLFHRAVPQSGAGHNGIGAATATHIAADLLARLGVAAGDADALASVTSEQLLEAQAALTAEVMTSGKIDLYGDPGATAMPFQPVYGTPVLPQRPIDAIRAGSAAGIAVLTGTTMEESLVFVVAMQAMFGDDKLHRLAASLFGDEAHGNSVIEAYRAARAGKPGHEVIAALETDRMFRVPAVRLADAQAEHDPNVWMYRFDWRTPIFGGLLGACHALELPFVFNTLASPLAAMFAGPEAPQGVADAMHGAWVAFASTGNPGHEGLPAWPRYTLSARPTMLFAPECTVVEQPNADEL
ncbi:MAG: carboxylesterase/lipase family protein, partial [Ilumatobacteraceae bacterium]